MDQRYLVYQAVVPYFQSAQILGGRSGSTVQSLCHIVARRNEAMISSKVRGWVTRAVANQNIYTYFKRPFHKLDLYNNVKVEANVKQETQIKLERLFFTTRSAVLNQLQTIEN